MLKVDQVLKYSSAAGKSWLTKYLHPPSSRDSSYAGYPDMNATQAVHMEHRLVDEQSIPPDTQSTNTLGCVYLFVPGLLYPLLRMPWTYGPMDYDSVTVSVKNNNWTVQTILQNFTRVRPSYLSITAELDATAFNNTGTIYAAQFNPSVVRSTLPYTLLNYKIADEQIAQLETTFNLTQGTLTEFIRSFTTKHYTLEETSGLVFDKEFLTRSIKLVSDNNDEASVRAFNESVIELVQIGKPINTPSDITMSSLSFYQAPLTAGVYSPLRINQPINDYKPIQAGDLANGGQLSRRLCYKGLLQVNVPGQEVGSVIILRDNPNPDGKRDFLTDIPYGNFSMMYFGIKNGTSTAAGMPANLRIKIIQGFEFTAQPGSAFNSFLTAPPPYDFEAINQAALITNERSDCYPASANKRAQVAVGNDPNVTKVVKEHDKNEKKEIQNLIGRPARIAANIEREAAKIKQVTQHPKQHVKFNTNSRRNSVNNNNKKEKEKKKDKVKQQNPRRSRSREKKIPEEPKSAKQTETPSANSSVKSNSLAPNRKRSQSKTKFYDVD